jgi:acid phosphatase
MNGTRLQNILSFTDFADDLSHKALPQYAHFSPDMLNDGHNTSLAYATNWTTSFLTPLLSNDVFMNNTLVLLTYDESETYSKPNRIVSLLLGDSIPNELKGTTDSTYYTHYSIMSTIENNWGLPNLGRYDAGANVFQYVADITKHNNSIPQDYTTINNSMSYGGYLNSDPANNGSIPVPNLQLMGAGGPVLDSVKKIWGSMESTASPYDGSGFFHDGDANPPVYKAQTVNTASNVTMTAAGSAATETGGVGGVDRMVLSWELLGLVAAVQLGTMLL